MTGTEPADAVDTPNPPGQPELRRQVAPHALALARMRDRLGAAGTDVALRSLARDDASAPAIALLDAWAVVADTVSFYSERIATEGFLRTAVQRRSVRELARTLGYELRPGVAAQVDLAFTAETAPGAPEVVTVPAGTPVQSVPAAGELPQTFETSAELEVRAGWNALAAVDSRPQVPANQSFAWVRGPAPVRAGDTVLVTSTQLVFVGIGRPLRTEHRRDVRTVLAAVADVAGHPGWTRLDLDGPLTAAFGLPPTDLRVYAFRERLRLFGWNAPDPNLLVVDGTNPPASEDDPDTETTALVWSGYLVTNVIEIDGDRPALVPGGWVVLDQPELTAAFAITAVQSDGASKYALTGPFTCVTLGDPDRDNVPFPAGFTRPQVLVHGVSVELPAGEQPDDAPVTATSVVVAASDPPLPPGRRILLRGTDTATGQPATVATDVLACTVAAGGATMTLTVTGPLPAFARQGLVVFGNVAAATHGESVAQVLGSGDGRARFAAYRPRRVPLTYVRATTPDGARAELTVRVDGVEWQQVDSLAEAGPTDRVYVLRHDEDGGVEVVLGDGVHGARPASGTENVTADYRVGIGATGGVRAGAVSLLLRRPLGIREVANPLSTQDWAAAETLVEARTNAPLRIRTLDRAVSVADHEDFARGYAGVGPARADLLWDGRAQRVLVTVLGAGASEPSAGLVADLHTALDGARDPAAPLDVRAGEVVWWGLRLELGHDPAYERQPVVDAVLAALAGSFGAAARTFAAPVTAAGVLVVVRSVPGVAACTVPRLFPLPSAPAPPTPPALPADDQGRDLVTALPGRWDGAVLPAQLLALSAGGAEIGEMTL